MANLSFTTSLADSGRFPMNSTSSSTEYHERQMYRHQLDAREENIFEQDEQDVVVDLCEHDASDQHYSWKRLKSQNEVRSALMYSEENHRRDPCSTLLFWHTHSSRDPLRLTKQMAYDILTFFQVKSFFLDFLFLFGLKIYENGSHFSNLRYSPLRSKRHTAVALPSLGRSDRALEICYNLQGIEPDTKSLGRPWSIRQTVVYHKMDLATGACFWLFVKGNDLIQRRAKDLKQGSEPSWRTPSHGVSNSLILHQFVCSWSTENWRWYFDYLEEILNKLSRSTMQVEVKPLLRRPTSNSVPKSESHIVVATPHKGVSWTRRLKLLLLPKRVLTDAHSESDIDLDELEARQEQNGNEQRLKPQFTFIDLQSTQRIEEKVNEALLVTKGNLKTMAKLKAYYQDLLNLTGPPMDVLSSSQMKDDIASFSEQLESLSGDMEMHYARALSLLTLVTDRKTLLTNILNYTNAEASKGLAEHMDVLTTRTTQETVAMRVIASVSVLVTIFFLPGSFISSLMNTDIVRYPDGREGLSNGLVSSGAIMLYLALTLPLMAATLIVWYLVYWFAGRKERDTSLV